MTDEQMAALLGMEDLSTEEKRMARQQAMTNQLRTNALQPSAGKDWASQLARGVQGGMAGYGSMQGDKALRAFETKKSGALQGIRNALLNKPALPPMQPPPLQPAPMNMPPMQPRAWNQRYGQDEIEGLQL
jgi:hypothetical protein